MPTPVIQVEGLSKRYRIGAAEARHDTLVTTLLDGLRAPLRNLRRLRELGRFDERESSDVVWALRDVSFQVAQGQVVGLIGGNGAGKSTLLKVLSRITDPTSGRARIHGRVASLLEVGTGFHPELTGRENVYLNGTILGMTRGEVARKFDEIVEFSGVEKFLDTPVKRYSSGMRVRLAFAVAAHLEPEILFIDEVLAVGDAAFQKKSLGRMRAVAQEGRTVLFVSHNMGAVRNLCSRCVVLEQGRLTMDGDVEACVNRYLAKAEGSAAATPVVATTDLPRQRPWQSMRVHEVRLQSAHDGTVVTNAAPLGVGIEFECVEAVREPICGFYVETPDGTIPFMVWSSQTCRLDGLAPGRYRAEGSIDKNFLAPGRYFLGVIVATDRKGSGDWLPRVLEFQVREGVHDNINDYWLQQAPGLLKNMDSKWQIAKSGG